MKRKAILNSPGYFITENGEVYNKNNVKRKTWFSTDGYERLRLPSIKHGKRVNRTVHLLVAEAFLNAGKYVGDDIQINHKDGNKKNNHRTNLERNTSKENINHGHDNDLYTYNLKVTMTDLLTKENKVFRSIREACRFLNVSMNYLRPRLVISAYFPIRLRYKFDIDIINYVKHISSIKNNKTVYVYNCMYGVSSILTSYTQISILYGISYINVGKALLKNPNAPHYVGGYVFSLKEIDSSKINISKKKAFSDRNAIWKNLALYD